MATYYFSTSTGDDNRSSAQAQVQSTPWKTLTKFNNYFGNLNPGDSVLFKRGEVFPGNMIISRSGAAGQPITIGAYGSGAKPIISGFTTISSWTSIGGGVYEATLSSVASSLKMVTFNGAYQPMGRWPKLSAGNGGYLTVDSHSGFTSLLSSGLSGALSYVGGEAVMRGAAWILDKTKITAQGSNSLTLNPSYLELSYSAYGPLDGGGFFIQNHQNTCTTLGEWAWDASTKKIKMYFGGSPTGYTVQAATVDDLVYMTQKGYITFDNLILEGSNFNTIYTGGNNNITIQNCDIRYSGQTAVFGYANWGTSAANFIFQDNTINYSNNGAITLGQEYTNPIIRRNTITNTATVAGAGGSGDGNGFTMNLALGSGGSGLVEYNTLDGCGYVGIQFEGSTIVQNNIITNFCITKDDGGAVYTYQNSNTGKIIRNNIILNGTGAAYGKADGQAGANGIYMDDDTSNVEIYGNTVANCALSGLLIHNSNTLNIHDNTFYNNETSFAPLGGQVLMSYDGGGAPISAITMNNNIFFAKTSAERTANFSIQGNPSGFSSWGTINNNYYARPIGPSNSIHTFSNSYSIENDYTISQWNAASGKDANSNPAPVTISDVSKLRFEYNATTSTVNINLGSFIYVDVTGAAYTGTLTLPPFTSKVLIQTGVGTTTTTTAAPTTTTTTTTAAPTTTTTTTTAAPTTTTTTTLGTPTTLRLDGGLVSGTSTYESKTFVPLLPYLTAGVAYDSDTDGLAYPIANTTNDVLYQTETYVDTSPATFVFPVNNGSYTVHFHFADWWPPDTSNIGDRVFHVDLQGVRVLTNYDIIADAGKFTAKVKSFNTTANSGTITITFTNVAFFANIGGIEILPVGVDPLVTGGGTTTTTSTTTTTTNIPPVVDAGVNKNITLPTSSVSVTATATDNGTIASKQWIKISGPSGGTIVSPTSLTTNITGLTQGVYVFQFTATDNGGLSSSDTMSVTVNPTPTTTTTTTAGPGIALSAVYSAPNVILTYYIDKSGNTSFNIYNSANKLVYWNKSYEKIGLRTKTINVSNLPAGTYTVKVQQKTKTQTATFTK